ncbi:MAG: diaminopimelate epimerase [Deferribacteraceae bacterium]|jgi:diaminopimelate epimerase|nr:diaminopimelate epimerase [Deferribacteraceae bacterium]
MRYEKYSGCGNDFIIVNNMDKKLSVDEVVPTIPYLCRRGMSIGADGFIMLEPSDEADFLWHFRNADGSVAEMCGNGARCAARFAFLHGIAGERLTIKTIAGIITAEIKTPPDVKVLLTPPKDMRLNEEYPLTDKYTVFSYINTGVPHTVFILDGNEDIEALDIVRWGRIVRFHPRFGAAGTNVNFIKKLDDDLLRIRTYERGVEGETLACGTGCAAAAVIANSIGLVKSPVKLLTSSGKILAVYLEDNGIYMQGEARRLSEGEILPEAGKY